MGRRYRWQGENASLFSFCFPQLHWPWLPPYNIYNEDKQILSIDNQPTTYNVCIVTPSILLNIKSKQFEVKLRNNNLSILNKIRSLHDCDRTWKQVKMRPCWIWVGLNPITSIFIKMKNFTKGQRDHMRSEELKWSYDVEVHKGTIDPFPG